MSDPASENDSGWRPAASLGDMAEIFADRHFWLGYRDAYDGVAADYDETFGATGDREIERAQVRYEDGYHVGVAARSSGVLEAWRKHLPLPVRLMAWCLEGFER